MDAFYEEDIRILGHAADQYHRIDIRASSRRLVARSGERMVADTTGALVLYESDFAPRWYAPRGDIDESALTVNKAQTLCRYKGVCSYYDIGEACRAPGPTARPLPTSRASRTSSLSNRTRSPCW
jgi:uncharacterized protein (DUF427 family)